MPDNNAKPQQFVEEREARQEQLTREVTQRSQQAWQVFQAIKSHYEATIALYDVTTVAGFIDCMTVTAQTLPALTQCEPGIAYLQQSTPEAGPTGMVGWMLTGHPDVSNYMLQGASTVVGAAGLTGEHNAKALTKLLGKFPPRDESRMLSLMVSGLKARGKLTGPYLRLMQFWEAKLIHTETMGFRDMLAYVKKQQNVKGVGPFRPQHGKALDGARPRTTAGRLYEMQKVMEVEFEADRARQAALRNTERFWRNIHVGVSAVALLVSAYNAQQAFEALGKEDGLTFSNALSAAGAGFANVSAGAAAADAYFQGAARTAADAGDDVAKRTRERIAGRSATFMIGFASAAAAVASIQH